MTGAKSFFSLLLLSCLRPSAEHVSACGRQNEAPRRTREKTSGTQGTSIWVRFQNLRKMLYLADTPQNVDDIHRALFWRILAFVRSVLIKNSAFSRLRIAVNSSDIFLKYTFASTSRLPRRCLKMRLLFYFGTISHTFTFQIRVIFKLFP